MGSLIQLFPVHNKQNQVFESEVKELDYMVSDNKVTDLSILPSMMKPCCQGKATYWLQPVEEGMMAELQY